MSTPNQNMLFERAPTEASSILSEALAKRSLDVNVLILQMRTLRDIMTGSRGTDAQRQAISRIITQVDREGTVYNRFYDVLERQLQSLGLILPEDPL